MNIGLPVVFVLGSDMPVRTASPVSEYETQELDVHYFADEDQLIAALPMIDPQAILTFGAAEDYPRLWRLPYPVRRRWINLPHALSPEQVGTAALHCFLQAALVPEPVTAPPLVSVFTPAHRSAGRIERAMRSLQAQTHRDWEWVIFDDSDDDGVTWRLLESLAEGEQRISIYRQRAHSGNIGELKNKAAHLCVGAYLVELDDDDELTPYALEWVVEAFRANSDAGFVYSDCAQLWEGGGSRWFDEGWAFGFGTCRPDTCWTMDGWRELVALETPPVNPKTIRHISAAPYHFRSWRKDFYQDIAGHNRKIHVVSDYELSLRSFLNAPMVHIPEVGYLQYFRPGGNTQLLHALECHRLSRLIGEHYDRAIHERLLSLGVDDFCWNAAGGSGDLGAPIPPDLGPPVNRVFHPSRTGPADRPTDTGIGALVSPRRPAQDRPITATQLT